MSHPAAQDESALIQAIREALSDLGGAQRSAVIAAWIDVKYPGKWIHGTVGTYLRRCSVKNAGAIRRHPGYEHFLFTRGRGEFELYDAERHGAWDHRGYPEGEFAEVLLTRQETIAEISEVEALREFAYEAHLRDYLAKNLSILEPGLMLWTGTMDGSTEYAVEGRRIDILAKDKQGIPVVIELKLSRGHERTLGQALYYRGKLKQILGLARIRIIMVASEISDELRIASTEVSDVDLFSYALTMQVKKLDL